jgi:formylglycine-generating enzyme required for sulfatase activity
MSGVSAVSAGYHHGLFLKADGTIWATGYNNYGQLGDGSTTSRSTPVQVMSGASAISAGGGYYSGHSLFLKADGTAWAAGSNYDGQLGDGSGLRQPMPVQVMSGVSAVSAGYDHSLFLKADGTIWATGLNSSGQLGNSWIPHPPARPDALYKPVQVMSGGSAVSAGGLHSLFIEADSFVWVTGSSEYGQLGIRVGNRTPIYALDLTPDTDGDGLNDGAEVNSYQTNPKLADTDGDGLSDGAEVITYLTNPKLADTDGDGLSDGAEVITYLTDPNLADTDGDGLSDGAEIITYLINPKLADTDGDGLSDGAEVKTYRTDPNLADTDGDGLTDGAEVKTYRTDPNLADTDGDGLSDGAEVKTYRTNPKLADTDGDGLSDGAEVNSYQTNPMLADTDGDSLSDGAEVNSYQTNPMLADTDGDSLSDGAEIITHLTNPKLADTDGDGLSDGAEINTHLTNPKLADTDGDGLSDGAEVNSYKTNPKLADTDEDGYSDGVEILNLKSNPNRPNDELSYTLVDNARNPDEDNAGYDVENAGVGYVGQDYMISVTEVTNLMYARFLNSVAKSDSLYGLYTTLMGTDAQGGIVRSGSSGSYTYAVKSGFASRPVNFVGLFDALRYINWLHNGMPATQVQDETTTENGAYRLLGSNPRNVIRNFNAAYFLPDQDEWHKAAFFDPLPGGGRPTDSYWPKANQTVSDSDGNYSGSSKVVGTSAGPSHYGTYDQGGNVWEWTETALLNDNRLISNGIRPMSAVAPTKESYDLGFRVGKSIQSSTGSPLVIPALTPVGEAYNLGDDTAGNRGAVYYDYQIGTYEVTNSEYATFLNAVAKNDSFYGLYNTKMGSDAQGGIARSGSNGAFVYTAKEGFGSRPVNFVTVYSAMRYCNWLHNGGQLNGDTEAGAYRLLGNIPSSTTILRRNAGARFFLPTEDEWYKAAFYDPSNTAMLTGNYWAYAVRSDTPSGTTINFGGAFGGLTDVAIPATSSYFGTFGQSGNAAEWTETLSGTNRIVRGGHYASSSSAVSAAGFVAMDPAAVSANIGFRIAADQAIQYIRTFAPPKSVTYGAATLTLTATASSGLPVRFSLVSGPATLVGSTLTFTGLGPVVVRATQAGDSNFGAAPAVERVIDLVAANLVQNITFTPPENLLLGAAPLILSASASSGLPVTLSVIRGPGSLNGDIFTATATGEVVVRASQEGSTVYDAASPIERTIIVKAGQMITFSPLQSYAYGAAPITLSATASSGLPVAFAVVSGLATVSGNILTITGAGTVLIRASQAGDTNYNAATPIERSIAVSVATQTIDFAAIADRTFNSASNTLALSATASSGLSTVTYTVTSGPATVSGNTLTITGAGSVTVQASQAGNANYGAASASRTFNVAKASQTIAFIPPASATFGNAPLGLSASATSGLPVTFSVASGPATLVENSLTFTGAGSVVIIASQSGDSNYLAANSVVKGLTVAKAPLTISVQNASRVVGKTNPALSLSYSGFVGTDTPATALTKIPVAATKAAASSAPGTYPITLTGGVSNNYSLTLVPGTLTVVGFGGTYEALLLDANSLPAGKLTLTVPANALSYTGTLTLAREAKAIPVKSSGTTPFIGSTDLANASATWTRTTNGLDALSLALTVTADGFLAGSLDRNGEPFATLAHGARQRTFAKGETAPGAGANTLVLHPAYPLDETDSSLPAPRSSPLGSGFSTAPIAPTTGVMTLKGFTADGSPLTATLKPTLDDTYLLWVNPYGTRTDSFLAGALPLQAHPERARFPGRAYIPRETSLLTWQKAALPANTAVAKLDKSYRAGFGPLGVEVSLDPWLPPATKASGNTPAGTLAQRLGLAANITSSGALTMSHGPDALDLGARETLLPVTATLTPAGVFTATKASDTAWTIKITPATGAFTGTFTLRDPAPTPAKPSATADRKVTFSGVLRQAPSGDPDVAAGFFLLPGFPVPKGSAPTEQPSGEIRFSAP